MLTLRLSLGLYLLKTFDLVTQWQTKNVIDRYVWQYQDGLKFFDFYAIIATYSIICNINVDVL